MKPEQIIGTWTLLAFDLEDQEGSKRPWGRDAHGVLIYALNGHMSVSINKAIEEEPGQNEAENLFDSILFYAGTYSISESAIVHNVTEASNPARIGKSLIRHARLAGEILELVSPAESFGRAILRWKRVAQ